jgi:hypothetical protein
MCEKVFHIKYIIYSDNIRLQGGARSKYIINEQMDCNKGNAHLSQPIKFKDVRFGLVQREAAKN